MRNIAISAAILLAVGASGCASGLHVEHARAAKHDYSTYKTFAVLEHPVASDKRITPMLLQRAREAMIARGFKPAPPASADLLVSFKALLRHEVSVDSDGTGGSGHVDQEVAAKTLVLLLQERATHRVVWLGWSQTAVSNPARLTDLAREAAAALFNRLPKASAAARVAKR